MTPTTFTIIVRKGPYIANQIPGDWIGESWLQTYKEVVADIIGGQVDADAIAKVLTIDLTTGTVTDVTAAAAEDVWCDFDANNDFAWKEMREWLENFGHDCDHLTGDPDEDYDRTRLPHEYYD
jgi:hypothetical protein